MVDRINNINDNLSSFKRKYYLNLALRGILLTFSLMLFYFLIASLAEYNLWLGTSVRLVIFSSFFLLAAFCTYRFLKEPLAWLFYKKGLGQEESARIIGSRFPEIHDRLLNLIQLRLIQKHTPLLEAGIAQKAGQFANINFENAIDLRENKKYLKYFLFPFFLILLILIINNGILIQSTRRIVQFNQEFSPAAPFRFVIENKNLNAFFNEDFSLNVKLEGSALPEAVYLLSDGQRLKLEPVSPGRFEFTFEKIQHEVPFQLEGSGFYSSPGIIQLVNRPELTQLKMQLEFPRYLGRKNENLINTGNTEIPEGTKISWQITTTNTLRAYAGFGGSTDLIPMEIIDNQVFKFNKVVDKGNQYTIELENDHSKNKDKISYSLEVIKDQYPEIKIDHLRDSILYKSVFLGGTIGDDYGITELALNYEMTKGGKLINKKINLPVTRNLLQQSFFYQWRVDSLHLQPGDKLNYYLQVWDNDGVNGRKSTKSPVFVFTLPGEEELRSEISKSQSSAESQVNKSLKKAQDLRETIDEAQQKLKGKQVLDWQDKKMLEDLVEQKKGLDQMISELQKQNEQLEQKKDTFSEQDQRIKDKAEQIQKLMNELLDPETKKLFEELEKLLKENTDINQMQKMLDKMNRKEINLEKELERTLELFKQMQFDYKLDQIIQDITKQEEKQEKLLDKTMELTGEKKPGPEDKKNNEGKTDPQQPEKKSDSSDKNNSENNDQKADHQSLTEQQEELTKEFEKFNQDYKELGKMADELNKDAKGPSDGELKDVKDAQQQSKESLSKGEPKNSVKPQRKSVQKMKDIKQELEGMQSSMEMEIDMQNLETLRQILHGLIKLSYDQETLMKEFNLIQQTDPKYVQLSQNQLKIKDDSKVLEDSLLTLAKRDPFLNSIVTKEVSELNSHLDKSAENVRERRKPNAASEMQLSMTSINNLALMLNDHFDMMMEMLKNATPGKKKGKSKGQKPSLSQLQKELNQKIEGLKNGPKSGRQYSEELAKAAAEQERIRRALQEMEEKMKQEGGKMPGNDLPGKMEQTEMDLVNKQITEQMIKRQKEIETRLLETEKSMREQNMDEERKGETAKDYDKDIPKAFEEYLRLKEKEVELLKSVPPKLYPYYKKEVNDYFKRIRNQN
jgi:hypothetical protein